VRLNLLLLLALNLHLPATRLTQPKPQPRRIITVVEHKKIGALGTANLDPQRSDSKVCADDVVCLLLWNEHDPGRLNPLWPVERKVLALATQIGREAIRGHEVAMHHSLGVHPIVFANRAGTVGEDPRRVEVAHYVPAVRTAGVVFTLETFAEWEADAHAPPQPSLGHNRGPRDVLRKGDAQVPDQVAFRQDFPRWRRRWGHRDRQVMHQLMLGERTLDVARKHGLSAARISQKRRKFQEDWLAFCEGNGDARSSAVV
jgi:hypothetical protein